MPSAPIAGYKGKFGVGGTPTYMIQVSSIDLTVNGETYDVSVMSGLSTPQWKNFLAGMLSWELKISGFYDQANDTAQGTLWTNLTAGTTTAISFSPNTGTNNFTGSAIIKQFSPKFSTNAVENIDISLQGTGALAYA